MNTVEIVKKNRRTEDSGYGLPDEKENGPSLCAIIETDQVSENARQEDSENANGSQVEENGAKIISFDSTVKDPSEHGSVDDSAEGSSPKILTPDSILNTRIPASGPKGVELEPQEKYPRGEGDAPSESEGESGYREDAARRLRNQILAARKSPEEVGRLLQTQTEQLSVPVHNRPPDSEYWRVRKEPGWMPEETEVLLLRRKKARGGPEFLLVLPHMEPLFNSDPRLRNLVRHYFLAFIVNAHGGVGWWAVPSRSEHNWHSSARTTMRRLVSEWGMVKSEMRSETYKIELPDDDLGEPQWPAGSYDDWFLKGFTDKVLDSEDHPVLKDLRGKKE